MSEHSLDLDVDFIANNGVTASPVPGNRLVLIRTFASGRMGLCSFVSPNVARDIAREILAAADRAEEETP